MGTWSGDREMLKVRLRYKDVVVGNRICVQYGGLTNISKNTWSIWILNIAFLPKIDY